MAVFLFYATSSKLLSLDDIEKYDFVENIDYFKITPYKELKQAKDFDFTILRNQKSKRGGDVRST